MQTRPSPKILPIRHTLALLALLAIAALIGCGHGPAAPATGVHIQSLSGQIHGGQSPIQGALIKLYHTDPTATTYGAPGILIGTAISDAGGNYSIGSNSGSAVNSTNCPAGTMAYLTGAGGYQTGQPNAVNNNLLLMDALGDCANISSSTFAVINEVTTVAAAYALSGFMTTSIDGSTAFYTANVSAPVANSTLITAITPTTPAGLAHAFMNAAKLANPSVGTANYTTTAYTGGVNETIGSVPGNEINTLADMMQPCINSASLAGGAVSSIPIANGGSGYGATVSFTNALGTGATANAIVNSSGVVTGLQLTNGGSGYSPIITFSAPGSGAVGVPTLVNGVVTGTTMLSYGSGYGPVYTVTPDPAYPGTGAVISTNSNTAGLLNGTPILSAGSGYGPHATVSASPYGGTTATFSPQISGTPATQVTVGSYVLTSAGSGYSPSVHFSAATGSGAAGYTDLNSATPGAVTNINLTAGGSGYPTSAGAVTVTIDPPAGGGTTATATATVNSSGVITGLTLTSGGSGYTLPTITIDPSPYGTTPTYSVTATKIGAIYTIGIPTSGSGYPLPNVTVAGTGTGLYVSTVTVLNGAIQSINLGDSPYGYDTTATLSNPPAGNSGTATTGYAALMNGEVNTVGWTVGTANYGPTVTITGGTTNATATANVTDGAVTGLVLTGGGSGYGVPTVTVSAPTTPGGVTATATATTANGQISGVTITNGGSGYTSAPTVTFSAPASGTTAVAGTPVLTTDPGSAPVSPSNGLCSKLMTLTPSISGVIPNNTLQAFINLARNPYPSALAMDPTNGLFGLVSASGAFQPTLTAVPYDWSLAVSYGSAYTTASTGTALPTAGVLALDANDTLFSIRNTALTTSTPLIYGVGAYGVSVPAFGNYTTTAKGGGSGIATDLFGNIWTTVNTAFLYKYPAAGGALTSYSTLSSAYGVAVDANNNVWVGHSALYSGNDVDEFAYTSGTWAQSTNFVDFPAGVDNLAVDAHQNIWGAPYVTAGINGNNLVAAVLANTGTVSAPNYNPSGGVMTPLSTPFLDGSYKPYGVAIDASGNAWYSIYGTGTSTFAGLQEVTPNSPSNVTGLTSGTFISSTGTGSNGNQLGAGTLTTVPAIDGAGTLFLGDATALTDNGLHVYSTITGNTLSPIYGLKGCLATTAAPTVCSLSTPTINGAHGGVIDSTGSVWVDMYSGGVSQVIGLAAPTYPALATGKPGLSPGLTAVNPLP